MTPRDRMLSTIRHALGKPDAQSDPPIGLVRCQAPLHHDLPSTFAESLKILGGEVIQVASTAEARRKIDQIIGTAPFLASAAPIVADCGFSTPFSRESAAAARFGITSADYALADTGSLVFLSESRESRLLSLLPPHHIVVLEKEKILAGLDDLFARVPLPAEKSSSMVLVTGPSRTGDIEMRLVRGVHGPGEVTVMIVEDVTHR